MPKWLLITEIIKESLRLAFAGLRNNVLRTLLSSFAIIIGILTIISILTFIDSLNKNVKESLSSLGGDIIYIQKWPWLFDNDYPWWKFVNRPQVSYQEMQMLQNKLKNYEGIAIMGSISNKTISTHDEQVKNIGIDAVTYQYNKVFDFDFQDGRYFTEFESRMGNPKIILGNEVARNLFGEKNCIGEKVNVLNRKFIVIGVLKKEGNTNISISGLDDRAFIPYNYARYLYGTSMRYMHLTIKVKSAKNISEVEFEDEIRGVMRSIRKLSPKEEDNFALNRASFITEKLNEIFSSLSIAGWVIAAFSILVGGFGTANIMFVSVKERTFLIGIEKALGAPKFFILAQFLGEAIILCLLGGIIALLLVIGIVIIVNSSQDDIHLILTFKNVILGISLSTIIGVLAGFIPAFQASKLDPINAIRSNF